MPSLTLPKRELRAFGSQWSKNGGELTRSAPNSSIQLGNLVDGRVADALAEMLGGIPVCEVHAKKNGALWPPEADCVEHGEVTIIGGIRKQQFDVAYRPDGVRFAFDNKTLNTAKSVGKNWQNMVNDLTAEAATVHTRFPWAIVGFVVLIPEPAIGGALEPLTRALDRLCGRDGEHAPEHMAEALSFALWDPASGNLSATSPNPALHPSLRIENFSAQVEDAYRTRYAGSPPH